MVHCSAGIGRSGVLVVLDSLIKQTKGGAVDIYETVKKAREGRDGMLVGLSGCLGRAGGLY